MKLKLELTLSGICIAALSGCGDPMTSVVKIGVQAVGRVVDDAEVKKLGKELLGQRPSKADDVLGKCLEVYSDVYSSREWREYEVPMDVLKNHRYVVEIAYNQIVLVEKVGINTDQTDLPLELIYYEKLKGKTAAECQEKLKMGSPVLSLRRKSDGQLCQFYDARLIKELSKPHYCVVRYDNGGRCKKVNFNEVEATTS
jgi:hypothetical protein